MERFYVLIRLLKTLGYSLEENEKIFSVCFQYDENISSLIEYDNLLEIKNSFPECLNIYIYSSINNEIDILDFLEDRSDYEDEIRNRKNIQFQYKLILNKDIYISNSCLSQIKEIQLYIDKENLISLFNKDIEELEDVVLKENKKSIFVIGDSDVFIKNDFLMITNLNRPNIVNEIIDFTTNSVRIQNRDIIDKRNEYCNWVDGTYYLIPESLYIDFSNPNFQCDDELEGIMYRKTTDLIIRFISNFTGVVNEDFISIINGNKRIEIEYNLDSKDYNRDQYETLFALYSWIYESSTFDKISICRNVISVLISAKCQGSTYKTILQNSDWLSKSVLDNFEEFLKNNIDTYFKEKNSIIDKLTENISSINNQVTELTKLSITNITSLLGTAIAAVLGYVAKGDYTFIRMLSFLYISFLIVNSVLNLPITIIRAIQSEKDFIFNKDLYIKLYMDDDRIGKMIDRNQFNYIVFWIYTFFTTVIIITIAIFIINTNINDFVNRFK